MAEELGKELGFKITVHTLRRFLKKLGYSWKRFRKSLKSKQDQQEYEDKVEILQQLLELYKSKYIDLFFADESGFNMEGYIPYGWQPKGEYIEITPSKTNSMQVFGLMSLDNRLESYSCKGTINSQVAIAFIDDFCTKISQPTVVVIDNAPIHHSKLFEARIKEWKENDLYIFFLPKYSPHLNPIEILWRKIKYEWMNYENIQNQDELETKLVHILRQFGDKYTIDFKELEQLENAV